MASTYTPIATTTLGSTQANYTFTSIPSTYTDLVLIASIKSDSTGNPNTFIQVGNGSIDTGTNYSWTRIYGTGSSAASSRATSVSDGVIIGDATPNNFTADIAHFQNYANTSTYKTILIRANAADSATQSSVGLWRSTSAINQIKVYANGRNMVAGTTLTLYGILAA